MEWWGSSYQFGFSATGGTETTITVGGASYRVHSFTSSGTLTVEGTGIVEYLAVAGGGSGGSHWGGGGGAGGLLTGSLAVEKGAYSISVGNGGAAVSGEGVIGINGGNSSISFSSVALVLTNGGGGGGARGPGLSGSNGRAGGSGGGGGGWPGTTGGAGNTPATVPSQGNSGASEAGQVGGGGGGASGPGLVPSSGVDTRGAGLPSAITGTSVIYAQGGSGGTINNVSGLGGGSLTINAAANRGGGGGGGGQLGPSGIGGSGIVIIRYPI